VVTPFRLLALVGLLLAAGAGAQDLRPIPALSARVTDQAGVLDANEQATLEAQLADLETRTGSQVAILSVPTTAPEPIEGYAIRVADQWQLGRAGVDDGVLIVLAVEDRALRVEVGYGLEGAIPDALAYRITNDVMVPRLADGNLAGGLQAGVDAIAAAIEGEELPLPAPSGDTGFSGLENVLPVVLVVAVFVGVPLKRLFGLLPGALATGGVTGFVTWLMLGVMGAAVMAGVAGFLLSLFSAGGPGRWSNGGGGFPRSGGSGGFGGGGGFSGGGGGFGGGGASGRW